MSAPVIHWFRRDLRLADNPALATAAGLGGPVIPLFILDDETPGQWAPGGASRWWLHHSLEALDGDLRRRGSALVLRRGRAVDVLAALAGESGAGAVHATRRYEPWAAEEEGRVNERLAAAGVAFRRFGGSLLFEPGSVRTKAGGPFQVFTPYYKACLAMAPAIPVAAPATPPAPAAWPKSERLADWGLLPTKPDWSGGLRQAWTAGEAAAEDRLDAFLDGPVVRYPADRDRPAVDGTSKLSPHLHFGEIGPRTVWHRARLAAELRGGAHASGIQAFLRELLWREFSCHLLHHVPDLPEAPFRRDYAAFPWRDDAAGLAAWRRGLTGYPIVDAGMRELWSSGWMHNRVRMIAASFLVKDLLIPWQAGEAWFWDTLVDADLANNAASWQWVAGSGADAAPYFRIFNPILQGEKFDPDGAYVKRWVPELDGLSAAFVHKPWQAPADVLAAAGLRLGETYPRPVVDHGAARRRALAALAAMKG